MARIPQQQDQSLIRPAQVFLPSCIEPIPIRASFLSEHGFGEDHQWKHGEIAENPFFKHLNVFRKKMERIDRALRDGVNITNKNLFAKFESVSFHKLVSRLIPYLLSKFFLRSSLCLRLVFQELMQNDFLPLLQPPSLTLTTSIDYNQSVGFSMQMYCSSSNNFPPPSMRRLHPVSADDEDTKNFVTIALWRT